MGAAQGEPALFWTFDVQGAERSELRPIPHEGLVVGMAVGGPARHAELRRVGPRTFVRCVDSSVVSRVNGTGLHGEIELRPGDVLRVGDLLLVFVLAAPAERGTEEASGDACWGAGLSAVCRSVDLVAPHKHSVVITGETGTGKEVVARRIHQRSGRTGPFVAVNCAMLSESLAASELFGHTRGAFTGANADQQGLFRAANHGTLLLDEVSDMPLPVQASLLRVLETASVRPVGATRDIPIDTRVVATSHTDLIELVHKERFRADLYARLAQWTVRVPPLRERRQDILGLIRHVLSRLEPRRRRLTPDLAEALLVHAWPLNVRGLVNALSIAAIASPQGQPLDLHEEVEAALRSTRAMSAPPPPDAAEDLDKAGIEAAMFTGHGHVASVARQLGVSRPRLYRMFALHGIDPSAYRASPSSGIREQQPGGERGGDGLRHRQIPSVEALGSVEQL
ncbi:hypothetical protein LBMAG42_34020 [Deltaproteobacteria bacterium]|nr:hypothetical protein LBMAG42_34020 [Deltaproteobacteria bacterium]